MVSAVRVILGVLGGCLALQIATAEAGEIEDLQAKISAGRYADALPAAGHLAAQGNPVGQRILGEMYFRGQGLPVDKQKAFQWNLAAAKQGDVPARFTIGFLYETGQGVGQSRQQALDFYTASALGGFVAAFSKAGDLSEQLGDSQAALRWYKMGMERGDLTAREKFDRLSNDVMARYAVAARAEEAELAQQCAAACTQTNQRAYCERGMMQPSACSDAQNELQESNSPSIADAMRAGLAGSARNLAQVSGTARNAGIAARTSSAGDIEPRRPPVRQVTAEPAQRPTASSERYTCNTHRIFRQFTSGKITEEQACAQAKRQADGFVSGFGRDTVVGQDTSSLQSIESCKVTGEAYVSYKTAEVRVNYSEIRMIPCNASGQGISR